MQSSSFARWSMAMFLVLALAACGGGGGGGGDDGGAEPQPENPLEKEALEVGALTVDGFSEGKLNPVGLTLAFHLSGAQFGAQAEETQVSVNGKAVAPGKISVNPAGTSVEVALDEGRNEIRFKSYDEIGRPLYLTRTVWAGSNELTVRLVDQNGNPVTSPVDVTLRVSDDPSIGTTANTTTGSVVLANIPSRTVIVEARAGGNLLGVAGALGSVGSITLQLSGMNAASGVANNDFSQGTAGWETGGNSVEIVPHVETIDTGTAPGSSSQQLSLQSRVPAARPDRSRLRSQSFAPAAAQAASGGSDLQLTTSGEGPRKVSRTFTTRPGTTSVSVRFRFVTSEVPGGYFGSQYNDYYSVSIRSKAAAQVAMESNTMNGLGLASFDAAGSTTWRTVLLNTNPEGDEIQVDATVANVADGLYDSQVIIDFVDEKEDKVTPMLAWDPDAGGMKLTYKVEGGPLPAAVPIQVFWARGTGRGDALGAPIFTYQVPAGTANGIGGPVAIAGSQLQADPAGTTHLIAAASDTAVGSLPDVRIIYGPNADAGAVSSGMTDIIQDSLRAAGTAQGVVSRTAVQPADQARAMFQNLTKSPGPLSANIAKQLGIYLDPGDAVIDVFAQATKGMTVAQARAKGATLRAAMTAEIEAQGPAKVSKHCADPSEVSVADVPISVFSSSGGPRFKANARKRAKLLDENDVYHLELNLSP